MAAEKCPVCGGMGKVTPAYDPNVTSPPIDVTCHGCGGRGWVETFGYGGYIYRDPCEGCPHRKPYQITWGGNYFGGKLG